jgi:hypothetical protein
VLLQQPELLLPEVPLLQLKLKSQRKKRSMLLMVVWTCSVVEAEVEEIIKLVTN